MKNLNYGLYYLIQLMVLYIFYLLYNIASNEEIFGQILYIVIFVLYYFCRDINLELVLGNVKQKPTSLKVQIYSGIVNLLINWLLLSIMLKGYLLLVVFYLLVNFICKVSLGLSFCEIICGYRLVDQN